MVVFLVRVSFGEKDVSGVCFVKNSLCFCCFSFWILFLDFRIF